MKLALSERKAHLLAILCLSFILLIIPIPFARLQDDEAIYYIITKELVDELKIPAHRGLTIVPFFLWAPAILANDSLLSLRAVTASITILTAVLIYFIAIKLFDLLSALTSSLLYLFLFHVLRFGLRIALDPFGAFFAILSLYFLTYEKPALSGASFSLAAYSYQFWIPMYPLYFIQAYRQKLSLKRFLIATFAVALFLQALIFAQHGLKILGIFMKSGGPEYVSSAQAWLSYSSLIGIAQGWLEFFIFAFLPLLGFAFGFRSNPAKWLFAFVAFQFLFVSLYPGFAVYGGASHYPYGLCPLLALVGGYGFKIAWKAIKKKKTDNKAYFIILLLILFTQFFLFNHLATAFSSRGVKGVYDLGYDYDVKAIEALKEMDKGGLIVGQTTHGLLIDKNRFIWDGSIELNPRIFMGYKTDVVFKQEKQKLPKTIQSVEIGPYIILSAKEGTKLSDYIEISLPKIWAFRSQSPTLNKELLALSLIPLTIFIIAYLKLSKLNKKL